MRTFYTYMFFNLWLLCPQRLIFLHGITFFFVNIHLIYDTRILVARNWHSSALFLLTVEAAASQKPPAAILGPSESLFPYLPYPSKLHRRGNSARSHRNMAPITALAPHSAPTTPCLNGLPRRLSRSTDSLHINPLGSSHILVYQRSLPQLVTLTPRLPPDASPVQLHARMMRQMSAFSMMGLPASLKQNLHNQPPEGSLTL